MADKTDFICGVLTDSALNFCKYSSKTAITSAKVLVFKMSLTAKDLRICFVKSRQLATYLNLGSKHIRVIVALMEGGNSHHLRNSAELEDGCKE